MKALCIVLISLSLMNLAYVQDVQLSIENSTNTEFVGYVWSNSKFVFLTPFLKAMAIKGRSASEKICGFELTSSQLKSVPFIVYLVDELSGLGEMQVKPHVDIDHQKESVMELTVEAYDCDALPHYSNRVNVVIHISNLFGPSFHKNAYSFVLSKDSKIGTIVGKVKATGTNNGKITYSLYHVGQIPFGIDDSGAIRTLSDLQSVNNSLIYFRVLATEQSKTIPKQSITSITIEILPTCTNQLNGIPDQLDYKIKGTTSVIEADRLIQDQHQPRLIICDLPSPFQDIKLSISLIHFPQSPALSDTNKLCYRDIYANRLQRRICNAHPGTIDLFLTHGGIINLNNESSSIGPDILPSLEDEFTFTWWMKRNSNERSMIFCFQDKGFEELTSVSIVNCKIIVSISGTEIVFDIPTTTCVLNQWQFYTLSQLWRMKTSLRLTVADQILPLVEIKENILQKIPIRFFSGHCSSSSAGNIERQFGQKNQLQIGVISLSKQKSLSTETVDCMSTCGEALLVSESVKKSSAITFERQGSSLHFTSSNIPEIIKLLSRVEYINSYFSSSSRYTTDKLSSHVAIDLSVHCKSGETVTIPRTLIKVNGILPQRDTANDTVEIDIYTSSTILAKKSQSIKLFPDFRFVNSITEESAKRDLRIDGCSIRPLQRSFVDQEKLYVSRLMVPIVMESKLNIKYDSSSWNLEGEGTVELYESILRHVSFNMVNERRKLFVICTLKSGELTSQAFVDVILPKKNQIKIINDDHSTDLDHYSFDEQKRINEKEERYLKDHFDITKSKFIAIVIMAVFGGATCSIITLAISCFIVRRRGNILMRNRMKFHDIKTYQRESSPRCECRPQSSSNPLSSGTDYECDEDRISMADVPDIDEHCLDNISCDTCNMTDPDNSHNNTNTVNDMPRSKTINFPIILKRF